MCTSPIVASSVFALAFGRNLDAHEGALGTESTHPRRSGPATQCTEGKECYVAALHLTVGACFVAVLLSVLAALRDRRKIKDDMEARAGGEVGWEGMLRSDIGWRFLSGLYLYIEVPNGVTWLSPTSLPHGAPSLSSSSTLLFSPQAR